MFDLSCVVPVATPSKSLKIVIQTKVELRRIGMSVFDETSSAIPFILKQFHLRYTSQSVIRSWKFDLIRGWKCCQVFGNEMKKPS